MHFHLIANIISQVDYWHCYNKFITKYKWTFNPALAYPDLTDHMYQNV